RPRRCIPGVPDGGGRDLRRATLEWTALSGGDRVPARDDPAYVCRSACTTCPLTRGVDLAVVEGSRRGPHRQSKPPTGPAPPRRSVCAPAAMSLQCIADRGGYLMLSTWFSPSTNGKRRASRRRFVPRLELLEGRTLPSTFTVLNLADSGDGS